MPNFIDLTGSRFGRLTVVRRAKEHEKSQTKYICKCDCGNESIVFSLNLKRNHTTSCGCAHKEAASLAHITHGATLGSGKDQNKYPRSYKIWNRMKQRCNDKNDRSYNRYGARGIFICDRWKDYANFLSDMGEPNEGMSIDRINNDGPYNLDNCRWATRKQQARNTSRNTLITFNGKTKCLIEWSEIIGIHIRALHARIKHGWSVDRAFTEPLKNR